MGNFVNSRLLRLILAIAVSIPPLAATAPLATAGEILTVWEDKGGNIVDYALRLLKAKQNQDFVVVAGNCDSACTLYLALPKSQLCVTTGANFGFHLPVTAYDPGNTTALNYLMESYPDWVRAWIDVKGGLSDVIKTMDYSYLSRHLSTCVIKPFGAGIVALGDW